MKKKYFYIYLILLIVTSTILLPVETKAKTISEYEAEVTKYTKELEEKKSKIATNDAEVSKIESKIKDIENNIKETENKIDSLQKEIDESNAEIKRISEASKSIIEYYQVSNGDNAYLEYAFGASSITDMIYRIAVVEQLTEYNNKVMKELEELIKKNEQQQKELQEKQKELEKLQDELQSEKARILADTAEIKESMPSIESQIKAAQDSLNKYKKLGCGATEDIQACEYRISQQSANTSLPSVGFFSRPMANGYIVRGMTFGHMGYDLSSNNKTIEVYPIAAGVVHAINQDTCTTSYPNWCKQMGYSCNGNAKIVVIKHNYNGSYIYSSYVHLSSYGNISVNQFVSKDTVIGYMGTSGCSTGPHLHLEIANCHWQGGGCNYYTTKYSVGYVDRLINPSTLITFPSRWSNR